MHPIAKFIANPVKVTVGVILVVLTAAHSQRLLRFGSWGPQPTPSGWRFDDGGTGHWASSRKDDL